MLKIRKGNPLTIIWAIKRDDQPVRLADFNIKVELSTSTGIICINEFNVDGNILSFTYAGNSQRYLGKYTLTLIANDGTPDMFVVDACNVFELVARSCQSGGEGDCSDVNIETLNLSSDILVGDSIQLADPMAVHYDREDGRSLEEQARARKNIGVDTLPLTLQYSFPEEFDELEESIILVEGDNSKVKEYLLSLSDEEIKAQDIRAVVDNGELAIHLIPTTILAQKQEDNRIVFIYFEVTSEFDFGYQLISTITNIPEGDVAHLMLISLFDEEGKLPADKLPKSAVQVTPQEFTVEEQQQARENIGAVGKEDYAPKLTSGFSENLVGDGSSTEEEFSFRPTAGETRNVKNDGAARIEKIKGNSLVWNQQIKNPNFTNGTKDWYFIGNLTYNSSENGVGVFSCGGGVSAYYASQLVDADTQDWVYITFQLSVLSSTLTSLQNVRVGWMESPTQWFSNRQKLETNKIYNIGLVLQKTTAANKVCFGITDGETNTLTANDKILLGKCHFVNLTKTYGVGNEPTTIEEFYQRLPQGVDVSAFDSGTIVNGNYGGIETAGFNQFNGTYAKVLGGVPYYLGGTFTYLGFATEIGGTTEDITFPNDKIYTPSQNGYIYAQGENININISWSEYTHLNGTYKPYQPFTRDLSWVSKYFPNGMRSAGTVRDEIRFNPTTQKWEAVQNVGVRAYVEGDSDNTEVTTDGTNTNYALATPIITEIDEVINMDYNTSDYGTEQLLVDKPSAPLVADIVYEPNALSALKNIPEILDRLLAIEQQISTITTSMLNIDDNENI